MNYQELARRESDIKRRLRLAGGGCQTFQSTRDGRLQSGGHHAVEELIVNGCLQGRS